MPATCVLWSWETDDTIKMAIIVPDGSHDPLACALSNNLDHIAVIYNKRPL